MKTSVAACLAGVLILSLFLLSVPIAGAESSVLTFATFGDYGVNNEYEAAVASMVTGWDPDILLALGDDYYAQAGGVGSEKYDLSTGKYYCNFLKDIATTGTFCPSGQASINRFFPALGDHDYVDAGMTNSLPTTYTDYFNLPGTGYDSSSSNERYYDFVSGPVHFFILNSLGATGYEPDGTNSSSVQAQWLKTQLGASTSTWNVVVAHNPPYSSGTNHGSHARMQWPFAQWGADVVFSGDEHNYERIHRDGIVYFVNGLGGEWPYPFGTPIEGSAFRYGAGHGAQRVIVTDTSMTFEFYSVDRVLQDSYTLTVPHNTPTPILQPYSTGWQSPSAQAASTNNGYEVNPGYAFGDDNLVAMDINSGTTTTALCTDSGKDKHKFYNYNLSMPAGASVQGIQVRLDAHADSSDGAPQLCSSLSWNNGSSWSPWKTTPTLTSSEQTYLLGGTSDTWGRTWTATELANGSFQLRVADIASDNSRDFSLDWVAVNVVYTMAPTATSTLTSTPVSPTSTLTGTPTPTLTATAAPTDTPAHTPTWTPTTTDTATATQTASNTPTDTPSFTPTESGTATHSATATPTHTPTWTPTATDTATATQTASNTPTHMPSSTPANTLTPTHTLTNTPATTSTSAPANSPTLTPTELNPIVNTPTSTSTLFPTLAATFASELRFGDVSTGYWAHDFIERLYSAGITGGCASSPPRYCPEAAVTRSQMAVFLERGIHTSSYTPPGVGAGTGFRDVSSDYWSGAWIKQLAAEGITTGCGNGNYCPEHPVTRAQMAVFLLRSKHGASYTPPAVGSGTGFGDVPPNYWAAAFVKQLVAEGITVGCGSGNYCPEQPVTRAQMAVFLVRTFNLP